MPVLLQGDGGKLVYAVDALSGLPRKKAAGVSHREPLHGHLFFLDQSAIDEYVAASKVPQKHRDEVINELILMERDDCI